MKPAGGSPPELRAGFTYMRHMWVSMHGHTRSKELYDKIKNTVKTKQSAIDLAVNLSGNAPRYAALLVSSHDIWNGYDPSVRNHVDTLALLGIKQLRPLLLSALEFFPRKEIPPLLRLCVCWSVRCLIGGVPSGTLEGHYARKAVDIRRGEIKDTASLTNAMIGTVPDDDQFKAAFGNARVSQAHFARYYLRALQSQADGEQEPQYVP